MIIGRLINVYIYSLFLLANLRIYVRPIKIQKLCHVSDTRVLTPVVISLLYLAQENLAGTNPAIIPYKVINRRLIALYGKITGSLSQYILCRCAHVPASSRW